MYKKILEKVAAAGTVALLGYEVGSNINHDDQQSNHQLEHKTVNENNKSSEIVLCGIVIIIILIVAIMVKLFMKKRQIV